MTVSTLATAAQITASAYCIVQCLVPNQRFIKLVFRCISSDVMKYWLVDSSYMYTEKSMNTFKKWESVSVFFLLNELDTVI